MLGRPSRLGQHYLFNQICLPLFGENLIGYRLPSFSLHIVNAFLIYHFFILVSHTIKSSIHHSYSSLHVGGTIAGVLFLFYDSGALNWISALCYQLVVFFSLLTLIFTLLFFRRGLVVFWLAVVLAYGLALVSHSYSLVLPLFIGFLEISWRQTLAHRSRPSMRLSLRYIALALMLGIFLWRYWGYLVVHGIDGLERDTIGVIQFLKYIWLVVLRLRLWPGCLDPFFTIHVPKWIALIMICGVCSFSLLGLCQIWRKEKTVGFAGVFLLFFIVWNGLAFFQTMSKQDSLFDWWRYYFNAVGFSIVVAYGMMEIVDRFSRSILRLLKNILLAIIFIALTLSLLMRNYEIRYDLTILEKLLSGNLKLHHPRTWGTNKECQEVESLNLDQTRRILQTTKNLQCKNLKNKNLSMLDLSEANLGGSNLCGAKLMEVNLRGALLNGSCLIFADLEKADLSKANLEGANLDGTILNGACLEGADLRSSSLRSADLRWSDLSNANLRGADLRWSDLSNANLRGADLDRVDFTSTKLEGVIK